jgi:opacity protein-like surface antigen
MRKSLLTVLITIAAVLPAGAQTASKWEFNVSLAHALQKPNSGTLTVSEGGDSFTIEPCTADGIDALGANLNHIQCDRRDFHGFNVGATYALSPTLGIRTDFSAYSNHDRAVDTFGTGADAHTDTNTFKERTYVLVIGPEVRRNYGSWRPFVHAMAGVARQTVDDVQTSTGPVEFEITDRPTSLALKLGGGIDLRLSPRLDLRVIEIDYEPIFAKDRRTPVSAFFEQRVKGKTAQNITFGVGLVWR